MNFLQSVQIKLNIVSNYVQIREILNIELAMACRGLCASVKIDTPLKQELRGGVGVCEQ